MGLIDPDRGDHPLQRTDGAVGLAAAASASASISVTVGSRRCGLPGRMASSAKSRRDEAALAPEGLGEEGAQRIELVVGDRPFGLAVGDPRAQRSLGQRRLPGVELRARQRQLVRQEVDDVVVVAASSSAGASSAVRPALGSVGGSGPGGHRRIARSKRARERNGPSTARRAAVGAR